MTSEVATVRGVRNTYGTREKGGGLGIIKTEGVSNELTADVTGSTLSTSGDAFATVKIPAGSLVTGAWVEISEAFVLGGTTPTILVGTKGSESTNGAVVSEALAEAIGTTDITATLAGTWNEVFFAAETSVGVILGGTSPTSLAGTGIGRIVVTYKKLVG